MSTKFSVITWEMLTLAVVHTGSRNDVKRRYERNIQSRLKPYKHAANYIAKVLRDPNNNAKRYDVYDEWGTLVAWVSPHTLDVWYTLDFCDNQEARCLLYVVAAMENAVKNVRSQGN